MHGAERPVTSGPKAARAPAEGAVCALTSVALVAAKERRRWVLSCMVTSLVGMT